MTSPKYSSPAPQPGRFRIGVGAGFGGDRFEPAEKLATFGQLDALVFECLAERTIAAAQEQKMSGKSAGYDTRILQRFENTLVPVIDRGGVIITNAGAANPEAAAQATLEQFGDVTTLKLRVAAVTGDDVTQKLDRKTTMVLETGLPLSEYGDRIVSANAYIGAQGIRDALAGGANTVITGRVADAALFVAPLSHHFGWPLDDLNQVAQGTLIGHLLECAGQLSGGYFADGERKSVPDLWNLGFPFADVSFDGMASYRKLSGTGGLINRQTVLEQLLYEIDDPASYKTPDVTVDLSQVTVTDHGDNVVTVSGAKAVGVPEMLKASVGIRDGYLAVGSVAYSGHNAYSRAQMAGQLLAERWVNIFGRPADEISFEILGANATRPWITVTEFQPAEVLARFGLRTFDEKLGQLFCQEVEALYTNGPFGGGGASASMKQTIGMVSVLVPRELVQQKVVYFD